MLFGVQLGGGTDIANAFGYCQDLIDRPRQSVLFLVSDLHEGGNAGADVPAGGDMVSSGVHVVVLLALSDEGAPAYDHANAEALRRSVRRCWPPPPTRSPTSSPAPSSAEAVVQRPAMPDRAAARVPARWVSW